MCVCVLSLFAGVLFALVKPSSRRRGEKVGKERKRERMVPQFGTVTTPSFLQDRTDAACLPGVQHTVAVLQLCLECWCTSSSSLSPVPFLGFSSSSHSLTHAQLLSNLAPGHQFWQPIRPATLAYIIMWTPSLPEKKKDTNLRDALPCAASLSLGRISTNTHSLLCSPSERLLNGATEAVINPPRFERVCHSNAEQRLLLLLRELKCRCCACCVRSRRVPTSQNCTAATE